MICSSWPVPSVATTERLGLAAGEQRRAVRARQHADLGDDRPDGLGVAAVDARLALQDGAAHDVGLQVLEELGPRACVRLRPRTGRHILRLGGVELVVSAPASAARDRPRPARREPLAQLRASMRLLLRRRLGQRPRAPWRRISASSMIASITGWKLAMAERDGAEHDLLGQLLGLGFDHQHALGGAGDDQVELLNSCDLSMRRVQHVLAVDVADAGAARSGRRTGCRTASAPPSSRPARRCRGRSPDRGDSTVQIDLDLVAEAVGEQRPDRAVDQAASPASPSREGRPSRLKKPPGILPAAKVFSW